MKTTPPAPTPAPKPVLGIVCSPDVFDVIKRQTGVADLKPGEEVGGIATHVDPKLFNAIIRYTDQAKLDQHVLTIPGCSQLTNPMTIGTRSVLFGAHQFLIHPLCLALAWWRLYGFPWQWQLWLCFAVHDIGYFGKKDIDGADGTTHPERGARLVLKITGSMEWHNFCLFHSRHYANAMGKHASRLCVADKLAYCMTPAWLYLFCTGLTGELKEYMANGQKATCPPCTFHETWCLRSPIPAHWHRGLYRYMLRWVARHHHDQATGWLTSTRT